MLIHFCSTQYQTLADEMQWRLVFPEPRLCTDNAVMIAWAGMERFAAGLITPPELLQIKPRYVTQSCARVPSDFSATKPYSKQIRFSSLDI